MAWIPMNAGFPESQADVAPAASFQEFHPPRREQDHSQQQPAVTPAVNVGFAIGAGAVTNRQVHPAQIELGSAKDKVEISKTAEVAQLSAVSSACPVVRPEHDLGAAKSVLDF